MRKYGYVIFSALGFLVFNSGAASAWGDLGHKVICEIAFELVKPETKAAIQNLMVSDANTFPNACGYPDHPRIRKSEHFVNLPRDSKGLTSDECPSASQCVLTAIRDDLKILSSKTENDAAKLIALKSLAHWVGDIHQPLHVSFADDLGGNLIHASGSCRQLHSVWDRCLVEYAVGSSVVNTVADLIQDLTPETKAAWISTSPRDWANESFVITESVWTGYCVMKGASCEKPVEDVTISTEYLETNKPVVLEQLQKAGVRLAHVLDVALAN